MECPTCGHKTGDTALMRCSHCDQVFERGGLEEYQHLAYLLEWLKMHHTELGQAADRLLVEVQTRQEAALQALGVIRRTTIEALRELTLARAALVFVSKSPQAPTWAGRTVSEELGQRIVRMDAESSGWKAEVPPPGEIEVIDYVMAVALHHLSKPETYAQALRAAEFKTYLDECKAALLRPPILPEAKPIVTATATTPPTIPEEAVPELVLAKEPEQETPAAPPLAPVLEVSAATTARAEKASKVVRRPSARPRPPRPRVDWGKVWQRTVDAALSGELLTGMLYLGAFMIVASLAVLVVRFWEIFPPIAQVGFIFAVPTAFYVFGWVARHKLRLPMAGSVFTATGALLLAVDFVAIYRFGRPPIDLALYALISSLLCAGVYGVTAWRLPGRLFDAFYILAGASAVFSLGFVLRLPLAWTLAFIAVYAALLAALAGRLARAGEAWQETAWTARWLPIAGLPVILAVSLLLPGGISFGQSVAFGAAAVAYGLLAVNFPALILTCAAVGCSLAAAALALIASRLSSEWYPLAAALLANLYVALAYRMERRLPDELPNRRYHLVSVYVVNGLLAAIAVLGSWAALKMHFAAEQVTLLALSAGLAGWAVVYRRPWLAWTASALFIVPYSLQVDHWLDGSPLSTKYAWLAASWAALSLVYLLGGRLLRRFPSYATGLFMTAELLALPGVILTLASAWPFSMLKTSIISLAALSGWTLFYAASALLHHQGRDEAISRPIQKVFPGNLKENVFLWPFFGLLPLWLFLAWGVLSLQLAWLGPILAILALCYVPLGVWLRRYKASYRLPTHVLAYLIGAAALIPASGERLALITALYLDVLVLAALARSYRRPVEIGLAGLLFLAPFTLTLDLLGLDASAYALAYALLASLGYLPAGLWLDRTARRYALPLYVIGLGISALAVDMSFLDRYGFFEAPLPWVEVAVPLVAAAGLAFSAVHFNLKALAWAATALLGLAYWQVLWALEASFDYHALAWGGLGLVLLLVERSLASLRTRRLDIFSLPFIVSVCLTTTAALLLTLPAMQAAFLLGKTQGLLSTILAQALLVGLTWLAARLYHTRWTLYLAPWLAFLATTLFVVAYSNEILGLPLLTAAYALVWSGLGVLHLGLATLLDRSSERYSHGLYLGGYLLVGWAVVWPWSWPDIFIWTLGVWTAVAAASAAWVQAGRHHTWDDLCRAIRGPQQAQLVLRGAFAWLAAWSFPAWLALLLIRIGLIESYAWLGLILPAIAYLGLVGSLRRFGKIYQWPLNSAAQFYALLALALSLAALFEPQLAGQPVLAGGVIAVQVAAVIFYAMSAWRYHQALFAHLASWLSLLPFTLAWIVYTPVEGARLAVPWCGLAAGLALVGFLLDRMAAQRGPAQAQAPVTDGTGGKRQRKASQAEGRLPYAHGPYLAGYLLALFSIAWGTPDRLAQLIALGAAIGLALLSQAVVHLGWHTTFEDWLQWLWRNRPLDSPGFRGLQTAFLFFAAFAFPAWLALWLGYREFIWAGRGLALTIVAAVYAGLARTARRLRREYGWPFYSASLLLTIAGGLAAFADPRLAVYALAVDALIYAAYAWLLQRSFWLYLSTLLAPVVMLLALDLYGLLSPASGSGGLLGLAYLYIAGGWWINRRSEPSGEVGEWSLPFLVPGYLISAVALAVGSQERSLAISVYLGGAALYALSAWAFNQALFLYPAVWLLAVPYYLGMTLTRLPAAWYGLGWLPFVLACIAVGWWVFGRSPLSVGLWQTRAQRWLGWLEKPAAPFYLLGYLLSVSMVGVSLQDPLARTVTLACAAGLYLGSAALFKRPAWLYPALLASHLTVLSHFIALPTGQPPASLAVPFLGVTWITAWLGYAASRWLPPAGGSEEPRHVTYSLRGKTFDLRLPPCQKWLRTYSWAQPFFIFAALDILIWQVVALGSAPVAAGVAVGFALLLGLFALLWRDPALPYAVLALLLLAQGAAMQSLGWPLAIDLAWFGASGLLLFFAGKGLEWLEQRLGEGAGLITIWVDPFLRFAFVISLASLVGTLPFAGAYPSALAAALATAGAQYLGRSIRHPSFRWSYLGMAMMLAAWCLELVVREVAQPQFYAIPGGLYLVFIGYLERHRGNKRLAVVIEGLGMAVLLVTSFMQSLRGEGSFPYFILLMAECLLAIWYGAVQHFKSPFLTGLGAGVVSVLAQLGVLIAVYEVYRLFVILGLGVALSILMVFVERRREYLRGQAQKWASTLESWE